MMTMNKLRSLKNLKLRLLKY